MIGDGSFERILVRVEQADADDCATGYVVVSQFDDDGEVSMIHGPFVQAEQALAAAGRIAMNLAADGLDGFVHRVLPVYAYEEETADV